MPPNNPPHAALKRAVNAAITRGEPAYTQIAPPPRESVMSFDPDGSIEFTRNKNLDTFFGGAGTMKRVTDISKIDNGSLFFIKWLMGPYATRSHSFRQHVEVFGSSAVAWDCIVDDNTQTLMFFSYEAAVFYEIACLNKMRLDGITFDETTRP